MSAEAIEPGSWEGLIRFVTAVARHPLLTAEQERELALDIEAGLYAGRLLEDGTERSSRDAEDLRRLRAAGEAAFERFVLSNMRLVVHIARRHQSRGMDLDDLVQEGILGLIRAVKGFDFAQGLKFSTYATWWIRQAITRGIADRARLVRVPVHVEDQISTMRRAETDFAAREGRSGSPAEIAAELDIDPYQVVLFRRYASNPVPLDLIVSDGEGGFGPLAEMLSDDEDPLPFDMVAAQDLKVRVRQVLDMLPRRDAEILAYRFGLMTGEPMALEEVGKVFGLTRERIRQIEVKSLARLRESDVVGVLHCLLDSHPAADEAVPAEAPAPVQRVRVFLREPAPQRKNAKQGWSRPELKGSTRRAASLKALAAFVAREGHARVPVRHTEDGLMLGSWINTQRTKLRKGTLGAERTAEMDAIHPTWRGGRTPQIAPWRPGPAVAAAEAQPAAA